MQSGIEIGDKVTVTGGNGRLGVVIGMKTSLGLPLVGVVYPDWSGIWAPCEEVILVAKADYRPFLEVGDRVKEASTGTEGIIYFVDPKSKLPYSVGWSNDGSGGDYDMDDLVLVAKATYEEAA